MYALYSVLTQVNPQNFCSITSSPRKTKQHTSHFQTGYILVPKKIMKVQINRKDKVKLDGDVKDGH